MPLQAGMTLGANVQLERELGRGAMGVVWLARNTSLGSQVAVKVLNASRESSNAHLRFAQEAQRAAQLDSPHVVKIFDLGRRPKASRTSSWSFCAAATCVSISKSMDA